MATGQSGRELHSVLKGYPGGLKLHKLLEAEMDEREARDGATDSKFQQCQPGAQGSQCSGEAICGCGSCCVR